MPLTFDHLAPIYDHFMLPFERGALRRWRELLWKEVKGKYILEVGVGTGANAPFYPDGGTVVGIDRSRKMLLKAKGRVGHPLIVADVQNLPFGDAVFDSAVSTLVFCSVREPVVGLREIRRVLKPGGYLYMIEHVRPEDWKGKVFDLINPLTVFIMEEYVNRRTHLMVGEAGFTVLKVKNLTSDGLFKYMVARKGP